MDISFANESLNVRKMRKMGCIGKFMWSLNELHLKFIEAKHKIWNDLKSTSFTFQHIVESYDSPKYPFLEFYGDLESEKVHGDELMLVLLAKFLRRNITMISAFNTWTMFPSLPQDIILTYDGHFAATQDLASALENQSKREFLLDLFLNKHPMI